MLGLQGEVICSLCSKQYSDNNLPRILTMCGHTYCELCISGMITKNISEQQADNGHPFLIECPEDNAQMKLTVKELKSFPKNHSLIKVLQMKKVNTSFKDQSFNLSKIAKKQQLQQDDETTDLISAINECKAQEVCSDLSGQSKEARSSPLINEKKMKATQIQILNQKIKEKQQEQEEICLLHQKPLQIVCIIDNKKICSKCAIFGQHKGHQFKSIQQVQRQKNECYLQILSIFKEKQQTQERMCNQQTQSGLIQILDKKRDLLQKQVRDQFRKLREQITKQQKIVLKKLQETYKITEKKIIQLLKVDNKITSQFSLWQVESFSVLKILDGFQLEPKISILYSKQKKNKKILNKGSQILKKIKEQQKNLVGKVQQILLDLECKKSKKIFECIPQFVQICEKQKITISVKTNENSFKEQKMSIKYSKGLNQHEDKTSPLNRTIISGFDDKNDLMNGSPLLQQSLLEVDLVQNKNICSSTFQTNLCTFSANDIELRLPLHPNDNIINKKFQSDPISCSFIHLDLQSAKKQPPKTAIKGFRNNGNDFLENSRVSSILTSRTSLVSRKENGQKPNKKKLKNIKISQKYEKMLQGIYNNTVDTIDFTNAQVGDQTMAQICEFVKFSKARTIKFIRNKLTDSGIEKIIPSLSNAQILNLSQNNLTQGVIDIFIKYRYGYLSGLKNLILSQNKIIERKHKAKIEQLRAMNIVVSV